MHGVHFHYCGCDIKIHSVVDISDESDTHVISDEHATAWEELYVPSIHAGEDPNRAPTEIAPSTPVPQEGEVPSISDTPHFEPDQGDPSPEEPATGVATMFETLIATIAKGPYVPSIIIRSRVTDTYRFSPSTFQVHTHIG